MRSRLAWSWSGLIGAVVLGTVLWWTGPDPFVAGVSSLDGETLALGAALALPTTVAGAWRWHLVARGLGVGVDLRPAVASCYRAQFLNVALPGGVLGDLHRGVRHGRIAGATGLGLRSVVWERVAGQVVQAVILLAVLLLLPSPVRSSAATAPEALAAAVAATVLGLMLFRRAVLKAASRWLPRIAEALREDVRRGVLARAAWPGVVLASVLAVAGHVATYVVAARAVGVTASTATLLPLALLVLVAAGLPTNVAGWGPREGMAAWTFAAAGLGAAQGVATAAAYGALVLVASLPGAVLLVTASARGGGRHSARAPATRLEAAGSLQGGAAHG